MWKAWTEHLHSLDFKEPKIESFRKYLYILSKLGLVRKAKAPTYKIQSRFIRQYYELVPSQVANEKYGQTQVLPFTVRRPDSDDSVHRNFLRAQELYNRKRVEVLVQIVEVDREPKFSKMKRDITVFKSVLNTPIYLIGLYEN